MSFFIRNSQLNRLGTKRKIADRQVNKFKNKGKNVKQFKEGEKKPKKWKRNDEIISSDSDLSDDLNDNDNDEINGDLSDEEETAQEKRLRLAKKYLQEIEEEEKKRKESEEIDRDAIANRLKEDVLEQEGRLKKTVANDYQIPSVEDVKVLRGHKHPLTCLILSPDNKFIYSSSKDCSVIKWDLKTGKKIHTIKYVKDPEKSDVKGHSAHVLCLAISSDNKFLVSGCRKKLIHVWNPDTMEHIHTFEGHRDAVSGLVFRRGTHELFSCSFDRSLKLWNLDEMVYVETLFGHQDVVTSVDCLNRNRAISSGGRDTSIRIWKIIEESQLVFHGHRSNIECVRLVNEEHFVSCGDDGSVCLWGVMKKKPSAIVANAHGIDSTNKQANWVISISAFQNTDLVASGSNDGFIRFWKCEENFRGLSPLFTFSQV